MTDTRPLTLSSGLAIQVRRARPGEQLALTAPLRRFATAQPRDDAGQAQAVAEIATLLAPFVDGADAGQLGDAFTAYPYDMAAVLALVCGTSGRVLRGRPRR